MLPKVQRVTCMRGGPYFINWIGQFCSVKEEAHNDHQKESRKNKDKLRQSWVCNCKIGTSSSVAISWLQNQVGRQLGMGWHDHSYGFWWPHTHCVGLLCPLYLLYFTPPFPPYPHVGCLSFFPSLYLYSSNPVLSCSLCYLLQSLSLQVSAWCCRSSLTLHKRLCALFLSPLHNIHIRAERTLFELKRG